MAKELYMWLKDIAEVTGISLQNVYTFVSRNEIPTFRLQGEKGAYVDAALYLAKLKERRNAHQAELLERHLNGDGRRLVALAVNG